MNELQILAEIEQRTAQSVADLRGLHQAGRAVDHILSLYRNAQSHLQSRIAELKHIQRFSAPAAEPAETAKKA